LGGGADFALTEFRPIFTIFDHHRANKTMSVTTTSEGSVCREALTDQWYNQLLEEVDYQCSFCDALHTDIREMEEKVKAAYARTASSLKGVYDVREIVNRWYGMFAFSYIMLERARFLQQTNQICGVDLSTLLEYQKESYDRLVLHCPELADSCG
jgi:hypothetical protein